MQELTWKVDGEFLTRLVREKLWIDKQPYCEVEELLLGCLMTDQLTLEERKEIARQILSGKKKLVGINSFTLEDDNDTSICSFDLSIDILLKTIFNLKSQAIQLNSQVAELEEQLEKSNEALSRSAKLIEEYEALANDITEYMKRSTDPIKKLEHHLMHSNMVDLISWKDMFRDVTEETKKDFVDWCTKYNIYPSKNVYGGWTWYCFHDKDTDKLLQKEDFIRLGIIPEEKESEKSRMENPNPEVPDDVDVEEQEPDLEYGWLAPSGNFTPGPFGSHEELAYEIIKENGWEDEFWDWGVPPGRIHTAGDFLVQVKNYVLLDCPCGIGDTNVTRDINKKLTKAQKEFLYDYLIKDGQDFLANHMFENW